MPQRPLYKRSMRIKLLKNKYRMEFAPFAVLVVLFVLLTPGLLLRIPPGGGKLTVAIVHAILFAVIYSFLVAYIDFGDANSDSFKDHSTGVAAAAPRACKRWARMGGRGGVSYCAEYF